MSKNYDYYGNEISKKPRKPWINTAIYVSAGLVVAGSIAGLTTWLILSNRDDYGFVDQNAEGVVEYSFDSTNPETKLNGDFEFKVYEYGSWYGDIPKEAPIYFLGKDGIQMLVDKMKTDLVFGPEIMNLKAIHINNQNMTTENENGIYFPATNEIGINTNNLGQKLFNIGDKSFLAPKYRVELAFQTLSHEYGHHIAHSYMNSSFDNYTTDIFTENANGGRSRDNWNNHFINTFKNSLDYSNDLGPMDQTGALTEQKNIQGNITEPGMISIGSVYDAQDLYDKANSLVNPSYDSRKMVFADVNAFNAGTTIFSKLSPIDTDNLSYLYNMQELATRKYQQIFLKESTESEMLLAERISGANLENEINYETPRSRNNLTNPFRYLQDNLYNEGIPGENPAREIFEELKLQMGIDKNVSFMWGKNDSHVVFDQVRGLTIQNDNPLNGSNNDLIRMGGYIETDSISKYSKIGYIDNSGSQPRFIPIDDIKIFKYNFNLKGNVMDKSWTGSGDTNYDSSINYHYIWTSENHIPVSTYVGKQLVLSDGTTNVVLPLTSSRNSSDSGYASNYLSHNPAIHMWYGHEEQEIAYDFYSADDSTGNVVVNLKKRRAGA